jgi:hypothetical protein
MSKYIPVEPEKWAAMVQDQASLVRYKEICDELDDECTQLKAEVERLTAFTTRTIIPNEELQAQVERLTKAGDAMASRTEFFQKRWDSDELCQEVEAWNAAKEGKGQP